jgi:hypothetical protein
MALWHGNYERVKNPARLHRSVQTRTCLPTPEFDAFDSRDRHRMFDECGSPPAGPSNRVDEWPAAQGEVASSATNGPAVRVIFSQRPRPRRPADTNGYRRKQRGRHDKAAA